MRNFLALATVHPTTNAQQGIATGQNMNKHQIWRTHLHPQDPDYLDPDEGEDEEFIEPDDEQYDPDRDYQGEE